RGEPRQRFGRDTSVHHEGRRDRDRGLLLLAAQHGLVLLHAEVVRRHHSLAGDVAFVIAVLVAHASAARQRGGGGEQEQQVDRARQQIAPAKAAGAAGQLRKSGLVVFHEGSGLKTYGFSDRR